MSFLPQDYKIPQGPSNYMRFEPGANKFRIIGDAITGFVYWTEEDGKKSPVRIKKLMDAPADKRSGEGRAKHFWAFPVYNYQAEMVQVLEITQVSIQTAIEAYITNPDWGDPKEFDITVAKKGEGWDTEYVVTPSPKKALPKELAERAVTTPVNMEALFTNEDPFGGGMDAVENLNLDDIIK